MQNARELGYFQIAIVHPRHCHDWDVPCRCTRPQLAGDIASVEKRQTNVENDKIWDFGLDPSERVDAVADADGFISTENQRPPIQFAKVSVIFDNQWQPASLILGHVDCVLR